VLDDVLRLDKFLSTDGRVLIIDQICPVIPDPCRFPDVIEDARRKIYKDRFCVNTKFVEELLKGESRVPTLVSNLLA
jgi:hypothetical protein